jgi:hypothetical protein
MAAMYSSPVILASVDRSIIRNGSGFLFKPGARTFLVTNSHVMDGYREIRSSQGAAVFTFGGLSFEPNIIDEATDENIDLVTIDVEGMEFVQRAPGYWDSTASELQTYAPSSWPLPAAKKGEATVVVGWPGKFRSLESDRHLEFAAFPMIGQFVDEVNDKWFATPFDRDQMISNDFDPSNPVVHETAMGGISGSPVFALHRGLEALQLVGIVRAYGENWDILFCARADLVGLDGQIAATRPNQASNA